MSESKLDLLLVDDREDGLIALEAVLGDRGYNLIRAKSGGEAVGLVPLYDFAAILLDVQMPGIDGFEAAALIRQLENGRDVPILFITAINKDESYIHRGYDVGAVDYLFKPFDPHVLQAKVAFFTELFEKNRRLREQADLIDRIRTREQLHERTRMELENLRRYQGLADAIPHLVWQMGPEGSLVYCNKLWRDYTGLEIETSTGRRWLDAFDSDDIKPFLQSWSEIGASQGFTFEARIRRRDGQWRWHQVRGVAERGPEGEILGWIGTCTDIDDRKVAESNLVLAREMAESANKAKTYFLANMSHEIRTPLNAILGFSEILLDPALGFDEKVECVTTIRRNGRQLLRIIDEVLDISKVEAGRLELDRRPMDLQEMFNELQSSLNLRAVEKGLSLRLQSTGSFPKAVVTDAVRYKQILSNLVGNAIKFTERGFVSIQVSWKESSVDRGHLRVEIADSGIGIGAEHVGRLFNPFAQADASTTRRFGGTGLGLALSRRLARALGGDVTLVASEPGRGSLFAVEIEAEVLPSTAFLTDLRGEKSPISVDEDAAISLGGLHILLVEDAPDNQMLMMRFLQAAGARVDLATNGLEAVEKALERDYELVLMDIQMPQLDGYQATAQLRRQGYHRPIVALTAHALVEERDRCLQAGCDGHLTKPVERKALLESVIRFSRPPRSVSERPPEASL